MKEKWWSMVQKFGTYLLNLSWQKLNPMSWGKKL